MRVVLGGILTFFGSATALSQPLFARQILTDLTLRRPVTPLLITLTIVVLSGALVGAIGYYLLEYAGESVVLTMRTRLIQKILRLRISVTDQIKPGDLMSRLVSDTTLLRQITTQGLVSATTGIITLIGALVIMGILDWMLLLVTLTAVAVMTFTVRWSARQIGRATGQAQAAVAVMATLLDRSLGAFRTVKAAGAEPAAIRDLTTSARGAWNLGLRLARWQAASGTTAALTLQVSFLAVLGFGGARVAANAIPLSTLIAFMLFMLYLGQPITSLVTAYGQYQAATAAAVRVEEVLTLAAEPFEGPGPAKASVAPERSAPRTRTIPFLRSVRFSRPASSRPAPFARPSPFARTVPLVRSVRSAIDFDDVVFSYSEFLPRVHQGVTFSVPQGGMTAIVGPSGAGKSTVFALIERFYDVISGRILVNGRDIRDWPLGQLRSLIGYVEQDSPALAGTLRENLTLGLGPVPDRQLNEVLAAARLDGFVAALPDGLDGEIGYRGSTLSGGERQRVAIARALLRAPELLLLDEATSQLDAANEQALRDSVKAAAATTTVLVVAHRLSTVVDARQIIVMEAGRVRSCGTHHQLLTIDPLYRDLAATQLLTAQRKGTNGV
jgi:ATP-binding cassette subfamily B protein